MKKLKNIFIFLVIFVMIININIVTNATETTSPEISDVGESGAKEGTTEKNNVDNLKGGGIGSYTVEQVFTTYLKDELGNYIEVSYTMTDSKKYSLDTYKTQDYTADFPDVPTDESTYKASTDEIANAVGKELMGDEWPENPTEEDLSRINQMIFNAQADGRETIASRNMSIPATEYVYIRYTDENGEVNEVNVKWSIDLSYSLDKDGKAVPSPELALILNDPNAKIVNGLGNTVVGAGDLHRMVERLGHEQPIAYDLESTKPEPEVEEIDPDVNEDPDIEEVPDDVQLNGTCEVYISPDGCGWRNTPITATATCYEPKDYTSIEYDHVDCGCHWYEGCGTCGGCGYITCDICDGAGYVPATRIVEVPCTDACTKGSGETSVTDSNLTDNESTMETLAEEKCEGGHTKVEEYNKYCSPTMGCPEYHSHNHRHTGSKEWLSGSTTKTISAEGAYSEGFTVDFTFVKYHPEMNYPYVLVSEDATHSRSKTSQPYCIDYTAPVVSVSGGPFGRWTNTPVHYSGSAYDPVPSGVNAVSGVSWVQPSAGTITTEGITTVSASAGDNAGNVGSSSSYQAMIDYHAPSISYVVDYDDMVYNKEKERWESSKTVTPHFNLRVQDPVPSGVNAVSGLKYVYYELYNDTTKLTLVGDMPENAIILNQANLNALKTGYRIDIPKELITEGGNIYLSVFTSDNAGNLAYTSKGIPLGDDANKDKIIPDDYLTRTKDFPEGSMFINTSKLKENNALYITNVNDVKWQKTITQDVPTTSMAVYANEINDTIGLGYMVGFKYDQKGFGTDIGDKTVVNVSLYGLVGKNYKKLEKITVDNKDASKYFTKEMVRTAATTKNDITKIMDVSHGDYAYKVDDKVTTSLYFSYYLPVNSVFYYKDGGTYKVFNGNEILVAFDLVSYKYYDLTDPHFAYKYSLDSDVIWNTTPGIIKDTVFSGSKRIENVGQKEQVFWYDLKYNAIIDIEGNRQH